MDKTTKIILTLLILTLCALCYFCYGWYSYKTKYTELKQELEQNPSQMETLTPLDLMVLSGDSSAPDVCNFRYMTRFDILYNDSAIFKRDYLLYCYILALRDSDPGAAEEFAVLYLEELDKGTIKPDKAMLTTAANMAKQVLSDTCSDCVVVKYHASECLNKIYDGIYDEDFKDTLMARQYADSASKYFNQRWP